MNDKLKHFAAAAGRAKEYTDTLWGCPFDLHDLAFTVLGGVAVALFTLVLHVLETTS